MPQMENSHLVIKIVHQSQRTTQPIHFIPASSSTSQNVMLDGVKDFKCISALKSIIKLCFFGLNEICLLGIFFLHFIFFSFD